MINNIKIKDFKCFEEESLEFKNLTLLTGTNSSGKSSVIQAILLSLGVIDLGRDVVKYIHRLGNFDDLKNKYINPKEYKIEVLHTNGETHHTGNKGVTITSEKIGDMLLYPEIVTYLNSNRFVLSEFNEVNTNLEERYFGIYGEYVVSYFEIYKSLAIENNLIHNSNIPTTLESQVNYWIKIITEQEINLQTLKIGSISVQAFYKINGLEFKPNNIGTGISYIVSILIVCLSAKKENIIIIENPEIHLHPKAQAKIGEFFAFIASKGVQLIIETHNDHLINKIRYEVFKNNISHNDVIIHYKEQNSDFEKILIDENGKFKDKNGENGFPSGFYDATLQDIFDINSKGL